MAESGATMVVACGRCGARNRVSAAKASDRQPVCGKCGSALPAAPTGPVVVTDATFAAMVEKSELPVLLDMWAAWCGPCRMLAPIVDEVAAAMAGRAVVGKMDVDANPQTASRFGVQSIPTLLIFRGGREVDRIVGLQSKEAIMRRLSAHL